MALFWRLVGASVVMLVSGFLGESGAIDIWLGFAVGMIAWAYIIYEIWVGDAKEASKNASEGTQFAFRAMAIILTMGWAIYPIGYVYGADGDTEALLFDKVSLPFSDIGMIQLESLASFFYLFSNG